MKNIEVLLSSLPNLSEDELADALDQLCSFVKEYESEEEIKPVEKALPSLCKHLLYDGPHLNMHFMVSIFRRVHISHDTIRELISLYNKTPDGNLIGVLYSLDPGHFTEEVQDFVISTIDDFPQNVIHAFRGNCMEMLSKSSLEALYKLLVTNLNLEKSNHENSSTPKALLYIICHQTHDENYQRSIEMLLTIFPNLDKELKLEVIKYLSFFTKNNGYKIFQITANDDDVDLRLETIQSIDRLIKYAPEDRKSQLVELLKQMTRDDNQSVAIEAKNVLEKID